MASSYSDKSNKSLENKVYSKRAVFLSIGKTYINRVFPFCGTLKSINLATESSNNSDSVLTNHPTKCCCSTGYFSCELYKLLFGKLLNTLDPK